jgi:hypothetical protein
MEQTPQPNNTLPTQENETLIPNVDMNSAPPEISTPENEPAKPGGIGPLIGIIIIVVLIAIGGFYYWGLKLTEKQTPDNFVSEEVLLEGTDSDAVVDALLDQNTSDSIETIEEDLNDTDLNGLDAELSDIERELDSALQ